MPIIRIHYSELFVYGVVDPSSFVRIAEWSFDPPKINEWWVSDSLRIGASSDPSRVARHWSGERFLRVPPLSRLAPHRFELPPRPWDGPEPPRKLHRAPPRDFGLLADTVATLATRGDPEFSFVTKEEALAKQPSLFADLDEPPEPATVGPYKAPARILSRLDAIAKGSPASPSEIQAVKVMSGVLSGIAENRRRGPAEPATDIPPAAVVEAPEAVAASESRPMDDPGRRDRPLPSITAETIDDVLRELAHEPALYGRPELKFSVLAMAAAVARYRSPVEGSAALAACGLELAIADVLGRRVGPGPGPKGGSGG